MDITAFGGAGTIGGNKIHVDFGTRGAFFDFGEPFDISQQYCDEFLRPRSNRGLNDYFKLRMLPPIDCYRKDLFPSNMDPLPLIDLNVDAVFLSHAHMDHYGHLGFLAENIPIVSSSMTYTILRASMEMRPSQLSNDLFDHTVRRRNDEDERIIYSPRTKDERTSIGRSWILTGDEVEGAPHWRRGECCHISKGHGDLSGLEYRAFPVDHSIYGATAFAVREDDDWAVYTGDMRRHGTHGEDTMDFARSARSLHPKVLIVEGTRLGRVQHHPDNGENDVRESCREAVEGGRGLTIADFSANNFERLDSFIDIANALGKRMVVTYKDAFFLDSIAQVDGRIRRDLMSVYLNLADKDMKSIDLLRDGGWDVVDPDEISSSQDEFMLCFSFLDMNKMLDMDILGGTYIYSNSEAYDLGQVSDLQKLRNWITLFGMECRGFDIVDDEPVFEPGFHCSGHLSVKHLEEVLHTIDPEYIVPIHTKNPDMMGEIFGDKVIIPRMGEKISID